MIDTHCFPLHGINSQDSEIKLKLWVSSTWMIWGHIIIIQNYTIIIIIIKNMLRPSEKSERSKTRHKQKAAARIRINYFDTLNTLSLTSFRSVLLSIPRAPWTWRRLNACLSREWKRDRDDWSGNLSRPAKIAVPNVDMHEPDTTPTKIKPAKKIWHTRRNIWETVHVT